uniref:NADH Dehydrogenase subunit 6 n=1 Tax=Macracanthorhynchus hirudinaceus TaxID=1032456 RepID=K0JA75_MACHR|nr:NADH dehydrogenase subunit 6 [Macracanthorhynchus hirudinaceus]CCA94492.2 NADH Dehydrogenase subunit 6 [Macracanthorhynchus hirudinaceus]
MMEVLLVASMGMVKLMGLVPIYSVYMLLGVVVVMLLKGLSVGYWVVLLLGIVYVSGVGAMLVYVGAVSLFTRKIGYGSWAMLLGLMVSVMCLGDYLGADCVNTWGSLEVGFSLGVYMFMVVMMVYMLVLLYHLLGNVGGMLRLF